VVSTASGTMPLVAFIDTFCVDLAAVDLEPSPRFLGVARMKAAADHIRFVHNPVNLFDDFVISRNKILANDHCVDGRFCRNR
jgi:hypothetical protein